MSDRDRLAKIRERLRSARVTSRTNIIELGLYIDDVGFLLNLIAHIELHYPEVATWKYLTTHEAADRLGIKARSAVQLIRRGLLAAEKRGRDYLIEESEVERYLSERRPAHRPPKKEMNT